MTTTFKDQLEEKSDQELIDIYLNSSQYQEAFVNLTVKELSERNIDFGSYQLEN